MASTSLVHTAQGQPSSNGPGSESAAVLSQPLGKRLMIQSKLNVVSSVGRMGNWGPWCLQRRELVAGWGTFGFYTMNMCYL